jgi:hypothetical protein
MTIFFLFLAVVFAILGLPYASLGILVGLFLDWLIGEFRKG